jgi:hypothetical protein
LKSSIASPRWINLRSALEHVVTYRHSPPLAEIALRDAFVNAKIASRAALYHLVPHRLVKQAAPPVARDHYLTPDQWKYFVVDWDRSSVSQKESTSVTKWAVWETSGRKFPAATMYSPSIQAFGVVVSEPHLYAIWPATADTAAPPLAAAERKNAGRPKGTGYQAADAAAVDEMKHLIESRRAKSAADAARQVVLGGAFELDGIAQESIIIRLSRQYRKRYQSLE